MPIHHHHHHDDDDGDQHRRNVNLRLNSNPTSTTASQFHPPSAHPPKPNPSTRFLSLLLKFVVMALIISLFLLFLGIAAVALLHIFVAGGVLHRRRRHTTYIAAVSSASRASAYSAEDLKNLLPRFRYATVRRGEPVEECVVCLESFKGGEWCRCLPTCNHIFHQNCVDNWLIKVPTCPICRTGVQLMTGSDRS